LVHAKEFDELLLALPPHIQEQVNQKIIAMVGRLRTYPHYQMSGAAKLFRLRVGDYRVLYRFDITAGLVWLLHVGHRREVYR
jgi:mRNA interferase RelE/StbE